MDISAIQNRIENVIFTESDDGNSATVAIESDQPLKYLVKEVLTPPQIQIHIQDEILCEKEPFQQVKKKLIQGIKYNCQETSGVKQPGKFLKSISILLNQKCTHVVTQKDWILSIVLNKISPGTLPSSTSFPLESASISPQYSIFQDSTTNIELGNIDQEVLGWGDTADEYETPRMKLSSRPFFDEFIQVALANYKPLEIAQKELKLAKRKLFEARRSFFPVISGRGTQTEGTTQTDPADPATRADFKRQEIGVEIGQPLFQSGRIYYSEKQAKVQKEIAEHQVNKVTQEITFETVKVLYNFLQLRESLNLRRALQENGKKVVETTKRKKEIGVASESEYLGVLSGANQIDYKTMSQQKDLEIEKTRLLAALNVDSLPEDIPVTINELLAKLSGVDISLNNLVSSALTNRSEIKIASLSKKFKEYGKKVSRAEYLFKIDASGFVGKSGAAFKSESLTMQDSYNVGIKGVLNFGGNSVNPTMTKEKTAPDLGSTSRTETKSESVSVGLLDSLSAWSNFFQAKIDEEKAKEDFRKAKKDILVEIKEAYFNYQKARFQIESARRELDYRRKENEIAQTKDRLHQIEAPQLLQSMTSLTEAEIGLKEAISFYLTSIAAMEKAAGVKLVQ